MKQKILTLTIATILCTFALVGCGGSTSGSQTSSGDEASSSGGYPSGPITVVVPYGAGGGTDLFCRVVVDKMSQITGQPIEVTNVTGGGGTIGATEVTSAAPDGYKLGFCISAPLSVMPLYGETSYQLEDVQPICSAYSTLNVLAVAADSSFQNVDDVLTYIEENGGSVSYGGSGTGNIQHLTIEEWFQQVGSPEWNMTCVAYTDGDSAEAVALMSGEVPFAIMQAQGVKSYVEEGNLRVLMVFGENQPQWMKDKGVEAPTSKELGYECTIAPIIGFWGPVGIDQTVIDTISDAFYEAVQDQNVLTSIGNLGLEVDYRDTAEYTKALQDLVPIADELLTKLDMIG